MAFFLIVWILCAVVGAAIGSDRRMGSGAGFALGLILGLIGLLIVACSARKDPAPVSGYGPPGYGPPGYGSVPYGSALPAAPAQLAAGWHADPLRRFDSRFHDGQRWTKHVSQVGQDGTQRQLEDPL